MKRKSSPLPPPMLTNNNRIKQVAASVQGITITSMGNNCYLLSFGSIMSKIAFDASLVENNISLKEDTLL